jgi:3-methyladenine DNA glycosylase AlkD
MDDDRQPDGSTDGSTDGAGWPGAAVARAVAAFEPAADPGRAAPMAAYLRDQFRVLGIGSPVRAALLRVAWAGLPDPTPAELGGAVAGLWRLPGREYQYAACDLLGRHLGTTRRAARLDPGFLVTTIRPLLTTVAWWDTVDALRKVAVGPLVQAHPVLVDVMRAWVEDDDRWLVRSAIIHQLGYREATDEVLLFELCTRRASDREFFVAKAIGWALRTHARRRPDAVREFCTSHAELTPLARREALRHVGP